ncbi:BTB/POz domain protein [Faustovirus]|nr:BTB/POz domain protein [Faustovirus]
MNSFVGIDKKNINTSNVIHKPLAQLYAKLFDNDDFINESLLLLNNVNSRKSKYELPGFSNHGTYIKFYEGRDIEILRPLNYKQAHVDGEPAYYLVETCNIGITTKATQYTLTDLLMYMFEKSASYIKYIMFNVITRATDEQLIKCIKAPTMTLSTGNYMPLYDLIIVPEGAEADVVLKCEDGNIRAHKLILIISSPLFKDVIAASKERPIVIKFPFSKKTTSALVKIIYTQTIAFNEITYDNDLMTAIDYTRIVDKQKLLDHFIKALTC